MHFCIECGNMYYLKLKNMEDNSSNNLVYYCRKCGNKIKWLNSRWGLGMR